MTLRQGTAHSTNAEKVPFTDTHNFDTKLDTDYHGSGVRPCMLASLEDGEETLASLVKALQPKNAPSLSFGEVSMSLAQKPSAPAVGPGTYCSRRVTECNFIQDTRFQNELLMTWPASFAPELRVQNELDCVASDVCPRNEVSMCVG